MRSSKSRSRSKSNRNRSSVGNVVNRVFDSSGPEGKVRGTPQQIIEKYNQLARDAQLANDRVAAENFQQHAEHYLRMLGEAQREIDARREQQERENRERQAQRDRDRENRKGDNDDTGQNGGDNDNDQPVKADAQVRDPSEAPQPDVVDFSASDDGDTGLVDTPEAAAEEKPKKPRAPRKPRKKPAPKKAEAAAEGDSTPAPAPEPAPSGDSGQAAE
ncbi:DUF4167 domain-containing protein [Pseudoprimorskyibacter insulae]|uniref:DUF4167 domain-containing protein n=1 Tax=Pseudoprimorskyibacter insulae TaxID=1695997 RepID=A0A2R8AVY0_9RHOB|nr:DUF4167 domain-containing protein [Pseudoprimorskyibacter insulae]SPF80191.1 hypothetical protein PRI8871_01997 [Pseudoprimorskyibacter insulae]